MSCRCHGSLQSSFVRYFVPSLFHWFPDTSLSLPHFPLTHRLAVEVSLLFVHVQCNRIRFYNPTPIIGVGTGGRGEGGVPPTFFKVPPLFGETVASYILDIGTVALLSSSHTLTSLA